MCGFYGDPRKACSCGKASIQKYQARISGPLMDRIDLFVDVPRVEYDKLIEERKGETSASVRQRVERARPVQIARFQRGHNGQPLRYTCNAEIAASDIWDLCPLDSGANALLQTAMHRLDLSARGFHRVVKVARTLPRKGRPGGERGDRDGAFGGGAAVPVAAAGRVRGRVARQRMSGLSWPPSGASLRNQSWSTDGRGPEPARRGLLRVAPLSSP